MVAKLTQGNYSIGEISLIKDMVKAMEIYGDSEDKEAESEKADKLHQQQQQQQHSTVDHLTPDFANLNTNENSTFSAHYPSSTHSTPAASSGRSTPRPAISSSAHNPDDIAPNMSERETELRKKQKKKGGLSKEQQAEMDKYEQERKRVRQERVDMLTKKLIERLSLWTETDMADAVTIAFQEKNRYEAENLKMESFGIELLHTVGTTYIAKASIFMRSKNFLGIGGFFGRMKEKGTIAKEAWNTISSVLG